MADEQIIDSAVLDTLKPVDKKLADRLLAEALAENSQKIVVLDDDPTGIQTVHDVSVYTDWSEESIRKGFLEESMLFYILTNSRGFTVEQTTKCHREIGRRLMRISKETGINCLVMSRGDSTLRGHFPLETELLRQEMTAEGEGNIDSEIICPYFREGGRFTIGNVHYVKYGTELVPVGQTEFAKDRTFGYSFSNLCEYVEEKTAGSYRAADVTCIALEDLRNGDIGRITGQLMSVQNFGKIVDNAADDCDLKIFAAACYKAVSKGKRFLFRTAAALVKAMGGISDKPLLSREEMVKQDRKAGGIIVVGSYTEKTTAQLSALKELDQITFIELNSDLVLQEAEFSKEIDRVIRLEEECIRQGRTVAVYTKCRLLVVEKDSKEDALVRSVKISDAVQSLVGRLCVTPAFVVAKGGIASSDVGTRALRVKKAVVMGQIRPGIPVWKTGEESRFPGIPYVIFPGNVGEKNTLKDAVQILMG